MKSILLILLPLVLMIPYVGISYGETEFEELVGMSQNEAISIISKNGKYIERMGDISGQCAEFTKFADYDSIRECLEFGKQYNQVMSNLFLQNKEFIDKILY